jgi:hypothetical protein
LAGLDGLTAFTAADGGFLQLEVQLRSKILSYEAKLQLGWIGTGAIGLKIIASRLLGLSTYTSLESGYVDMSVTVKPGSYTSLY